MESWTRPLLRLSNPVRASGPDGGGGGWGGGVGLLQYAQHSTSGASHFVSRIESSRSGGTSRGGSRRDAPCPVILHRSVTRVTPGGVLRDERLNDAPRGRVHPGTTHS